jgi:hypothetical protein
MVNRKANQPNDYFSRLSLSCDQSNQSGDYSLIGAKSGRRPVDSG